MHTTSIIKSVDIICRESADTQYYTPGSKKNVPRYTTGREIVVKEKFENSQALRKGLRRFGFQSCDCDFFY